MVLYELVLLCISVAENQNFSTVFDEILYIEINRLYETVYRIYGNDNLWNYVN
jgi:hypothetical protein